MGHNFHITRAADWRLAEESPIEETAWTALVTTSGSFAAKGEITFTDGPAGAPVKCPLFALRDGEEPTLYWHNGEIVVTSADDSAVPELAAIAEDLGARLLGDDDEQYS